jgi:murein L,D-transpeptidase YcbB/YkuD
MVLTWALAGAPGAIAGPLDADAHTLAAQLAVEADPGPELESAPGRPVLDVTALNAFYRLRGFTLAWSDVAGPTRNAVDLLRVLRAAAAEGLAPTDYHLNAIEALWAAQPGLAPGALSRAQLDLLLTDAFLRYSRHVQLGSVLPSEADPDWHLLDFPPDDDEAIALLAGAVEVQAVGPVLAVLPPAHAGYQQLRQALARYLALAELGGWPTLPTSVQLAPGMDHAQVASLRERLQLEGDLMPGPVGTRFDPDLEAAVARFQERHGLMADGKVGPLTRAALNVPVSARVAQIRYNLERWRWLPRHFGERYILVDTGRHTLALIEQGTAVLQMRVIAGSAEEATPSFTGQLTHAILNPYWNVPPRIAGAKLLPLLQRDPRLLVKRGMRVFSDWSGTGNELDPATVDWRGISPVAFPYLLRQDPGPYNSLGRLKFQITNPFDIFLHDTPERTLFSQPVRPFSAGCIRLEQPVALAEHLLGAVGWTAERIETAMKSGDTQTLRLPDAVPVYVVYWTAWADEDGRTHFREDVYGRDRGIAACYARASGIAQAAGTGNGGSAR